MCPQLQVAITRSLSHVVAAYVLCAQQESADNAGMPYLETSAKSATNVEQAFLRMVADIQKTGSRVHAPAYILSNCLFRHCMHAV